MVCKWEMSAMICRKNVLTIVAVAMFVLSAPANAELINVNIDVTARTQSKLDGPIFGNGGNDVGTTWNQILDGPGDTGGSISGTNLKNSTGAATTVGFTSDALKINQWNAPDFTILTGAIFQWTPTNDYTLTISGLASSEEYDVYLTSFHPNENGSRVLISTSNTTSTSSPQIADNGGGGGNDSTWALGTNFVVFEDVEPDGNDKIIFTIDSDWTQDNSKRAYLNGFQIATAGTALTPPGPARNPNPADDAVGLSSNTDLSWTAGVASASSNVYFGTDPTPDSGEFKRSQTGTTYDPGTLAQDTYYWRIDSVNNDGTTIGAVWSFSVGPPGKALAPGPWDTAEGIDLNANLSWIKGEAAASSDVYFGTDPTPDSSEFKDNRAGTTYNLPTLSAGTTYYWRIDQINGQGTTTGDVWSFTTMPSPVAGRNTFLVPVPATGASWKDLAFLAAVPASVKINTGGPSVIALDGSEPDHVTEYLRLYNPANTYEINPASSLDAVSCSLAQTHWTTTTSVVLCDEGDYGGALAASALAGRMEVPLLFFDSSTGLSSSALDVIDDDLQCSTALTVNGNSTVTTQLSGISVSQTSLADDKAIITWMENNGYPVEYLAVCNTNDRTMSDYAPKGSLSAALLAAGRNGAVAALNYNTEWNTPFLRSSTTTSKPSGLPSNTEPPRKYHDSQDLDYDLGSLTLNGETYDWVVVRMTNGDRLDAAFIDFNDDGDYGDSGEYCPRSSEITINGKRYTFGVNSNLPHPYAYGELRFTYPSDDELKENLQSYHDQIGHYPKYMAIVGVLQVLPAAHTLSYDRGWCDYVMNDNYFADVDSDPLYDIATGRIVGEDVTCVTLNASRSLTYDDLQYRPASNHVFHQCTEEFEDSLYRHMHQLENCGFIVDEWSEMADYDYKMYGIFSQEEHGWPFGIARAEFLANSPWTVCLVEGTGCNMTSLDKYDAVRDWDDTNAIVLAREGAICFHAWVRGTGSGKAVSRGAFFKAVLEGASMGEAHLYSLNIMAAKHENSIRSYDLTANIIYGDPAVTLYRPASPTYEPANVTVNGNTLTVNAPEIYWVDYINSKAKYVYSAPGLAGFISEPQDGTFFATYTTPLQVTNMTQEGGVPSPLGWIGMRESQDYVIDEHWDNTRTIYWRVRFEQFNESTGNFTRTINQIDYTLTTIGGETDPPVPNPMTFAKAPTATGSNTITMTASTATDVSGVEYFFKCIAGPGHDSGWTTNPVYNDTGLIGNTQYTYTVTARDTSSNLNETDPSDPASATTYLSASNIFSVNFYTYGKGGGDYWDQEAWRETVRLEPDVSAGVGDWNTIGWLNYLVPWAPTGPQDPVTLASTQGATATFTLNNARNGGPYYWTEVRTTLIGDGNGNMMDGHANGTEDPYDGTEIFDMAVSDIPFGVYDVIIYIGSQPGQFGDGTGKIVFNGVEQDFTLPSGIFDGTFTEIVNNTTPGNYIVFEGVTGSSFTVQVIGNGFNHIGPCGFQFGTNGLPGDLDMNGYVNLVDYAGFAARWRDTDCDPGNSFCGGADINRIDDVDMNDLFLLADNWLGGVRPLKDN